MQHDVVSWMQNNKVRMSSGRKRLWLNYKGFIGYLGFNYLDKALVFLAPLFILYLHQDRVAYNTIEYIYSVAAICLIIVEAGIVNSIFFRYRNADSKTGFLQQTRQHFFLMLIFYGILSLVIGGIAFITQPTFGLLVFFISVRTLFSFYTMFYTSYYRLQNTPSRVLYISISVSVLTIVSIWASQYFSYSLLLPLFFCVQTAFIIGVCVANYKALISIDIKGFFESLKSALRFSWPIILNLVLFLIVNNLAKIYAYKELAVDDMYQLSFIQRVSLVIHMTHGSVAGYLAKDIYVSDNQHKNFKRLVSYLAIIVSSAIGVLLVLGFINSYMPSLDIRVDLAAFFIVGYTLLWSVTSFLELFMNKMDRNFYILLFSAISVMVYLGLIFFYRHDVFGLSLAMLVAALLNFSFTAIFLGKHKVFSRIKVPV